MTIDNLIRFGIPGLQDGCIPPPRRASWTPSTVELFREEYRADCLRIVSENYDRTMAINLDRELSEMFSNSSLPPRFLVLKQADEVCGFGCYTTSWMQYGSSRSVGST